MSENASQVPTDSAALRNTLPHLIRTVNDPRPIVVMTCGISGAGKSTLAHDLVRRDPSFTRLSVDKHVYDTHGLYGIDYPREKYSTYLDEASLHVKAALRRLLSAKGNVVLDLSFWSREYRDEYRDIIYEGGGRPVLVYLHAADKASLWGRVQMRKKNRDALQIGNENRNGDSAFDLTRDVFDMYWDGFEAPAGEGEIRIPVLP